MYTKKLKVESKQAEQSHQTYTQLLLYMKNGKNHSKQCGVFKWFLLAKRILKAKHTTHLLILVHERFHPPKTVFESLKSHAWCKELFFVRDVCLQYWSTVGVLYFRRWKEKLLVFWSMRKGMPYVIYKKKTKSMLINLILN